MSQLHPFHKLGPIKHAPDAPWPLWRMAVFLAAYCGWFALGFWLGCWVRPLW